MVGVTQWWTPDGITDEEGAAEWRWEKEKEACPYFVLSQGGPLLEGAYGPGTCRGGCWSEPRCLT